MKHKVIGQQTPFNCTQPEVIIIEAENKNGAFVQAYKVFTEKGYNVETHPSYLPTGVDSSVITPKLPTRFITTNMMHVRSIEEINL